MARFETKVGFSFSEPTELYFATGVSVTDTLLVTENGRYSFDYIGQFNFSPSGTFLGGVINSVTAYDGETFIYDLTGISIPIATWDSYVVPGDFIGLWEEIMSGRDTIIGSSKADFFHGFQDNDSIAGRGGNDLLQGGGGVDSISGGNGADSIRGGTGEDLLRGDGGNDRIAGEANSDVIFGGKGNDTITGAGGRDELSGEGGTDDIYGGTGTDTIRGGGKGDALYGGAQSDDIRGGAGADLIAGQGGDDDLYGGTGRDTFVFTNTGGSDVIHDFNTGFDTIRITAGAQTMDDLRIETAGSDVVISYARVEITLLDTTVLELSESNFDFT